jgi:hypothetical protein
VPIAGFAGKPHGAVNRYEFEVHIKSGQFLQFYRGQAQHVVVQATTGQNVQLPASIFRSFVTPEGVHGRFVLTSNDQHKAPVLERVS